MLELIKDDLMHIKLILPIQLFLFFNTLSAFLKKTAVNISCFDSWDGCSVQLLKISAKKNPTQKFLLEKQTTKWILQTQVIFLKFLNDFASHHCTEVHRGYTK